MNLKRGQVLRGYKGIVCGTLALGLASCSMPKLPSLGGPPEQPQEMDCAALNRERTRLVAERADLKSPLLSPNTDAEREAELTQLNGKLYTVEKAQFAKSCPLVANAPPSPPSAVVQ
jgi:hypothetical protein